jgi:hypothetical protein
MASSNAERQARWQQRRKAELEWLQQRVRELEADSRVPPTQAQPAAQTTARPVRGQRRTEANERRAEELRIQLDRAYERAKTTSLRELIGRMMPVIARLEAYAAHDHAAYASPATVRGEVFELKRLLSAAADSDWQASDAERRQQRETSLNAQFDQRVHEAVVKYANEVLLPHYREKLAQADRIINGVGKPVFSNTDYLKIRAALHPDADTNRELRDQAWHLVGNQEVRLRGTDKPLASNLPSTVAELLARRRTRK